MNVSQDALLGIFISKGLPKLDIDPSAFNGDFPAQVKVERLGDLQRIHKVTDELEKIIKMKEMKTYKVPSQRTYGPETTEKVLSLFKIPDALKSLLPQSSEIGILPEYTLKDVAGLVNVKEFIYQIKCEEQTGGIIRPASFSFIFPPTSPHHPPNTA